MSQIGSPKKKIIVEPKEDPVPQTTQPEPVPESVPEKVPAQ